MKPDPSDVDFRGGVEHFVEFFRADAEELGANLLPRFLNRRCRRRCREKAGNSCNGDRGVRTGRPRRDELPQQLRHRSHAGQQGSPRRDFVENLLEASLGVEQRVNNGGGEFHPVLADQIEQVLRRVGQKLQLLEAQKATAALDGMNHAEQFVDPVLAVLGVFHLDHLLAKALQDFGVLFIEIADHSHFVERDIQGLGLVIERKLV